MFVDKQAYLDPTVYNFSHIVDMPPQKYTLPPLASFPVNSLVTRPLFLCFFHFLCIGAPPIVLLEKLGIPQIPFVRMLHPAFCQ